MSDKTDFAGLTRLGPGEPLSADGWSFQVDNPSIIDALLRLGVVSHRHDGHSALHGPLGDPALSTDVAGGAIPADTSIYVAYTFVDAYGGETLANPAPPVITTSEGLADPVDAPSLAADTDGGILLAGSYSYAVTVVDGFGGETRIGPFASIVIPTGSDTNEVTISGLSDILDATGGVAWRLWKRVNGGQLGMVNQGGTDEVVDDGHFNIDCTVSPPTSSGGTTNGANTLNVTIPAEAPAGATAFRVYASTDGSFPSPCLMGQYPMADVGTMKTYTNLAAGAGAPPDVATAKPGANRVNADTDIVNLRLLAPAPTVDALPTGPDIREGDLCVTLADHALHIWTGVIWKDFGSGEGGGGGGSADGLAWKGAWDVGTDYPAHSLVSYTYDNGETLVSALFTCVSAVDAGGDWPLGLDGIWTKIFESQHLFRRRTLTVDITGDDGLPAGGRNSAVLQLGPAWKLYSAEADCAIRMRIYPGSDAWIPDLDREFGDPVPPDCFVDVQLSQYDQKKFYPRVEGFSDALEDGANGCPAWFDTVDEIEGVKHLTLVFVPTESGWGWE